MAEPSPKKMRVEHGEKPKLIYFNIPGKAEAIRLAFHYAKIPFEDYRFKDRDEFIRMKQSGELQFGQVPALIVQGKTLTQSAAILRYVGKQAGLYPEDPVLAAQVDALMDQEADALMGMRVTKYKERFGFGAWIMTDENVQRLRKGINDEIIPKHLASLEAILKSSGTGWLAGTPEPTIADFFWVPTLQLLQGGKWDVPASVIEPFEELQKLIERFLALPAIAEYYAQR
eukprot:TRINITY_DN63110_c0_g1_i1.p1 TRINITY_DN63110_c0_g1~~TRINITY_DN63110_c0_g1_i1.p1  ORF type:complete len:229 (-),score=59.64 TRINITY_DN63110_c0_g1_i1:106-792(-)